MNRSDCEAVLYLHRAFRPRRRTGRGFLTGTIFLDVSLLIVSFILATTPFVLKPGIAINLPTSTQASGIRANDMILKITAGGIFYLNDERFEFERLQTTLSAARRNYPESALVLEADQSLTHTAITKIYDAAATSGFEQIFIATQNPTAP